MDLELLTIIVGGAVTIMALLGALWAHRGIKRIDDLRAELSDFKVLRREREVLHFQQSFWAISALFVLLVTLYSAVRK